MKRYLWNLSLPKNLTDDKSTLVRVMAWCRQAEPEYHQIYNIFGTLVGNKIVEREDWRCS